MRSNSVSHGAFSAADHAAQPRLAPVSGGPAEQLLVICHGYGGNGEQQFTRAKRIGTNLRHTAILCPNGPEMLGEDPAKRRWFQTASPTARVPPEIVQQAADVLGGIVDAELARLGPLPNGYAMLGFSQGANVVLTLGLNRPADPPRALLAFASSITVADDYRPVITSRPPVLISHGIADPTIPIATARKTAEFLMAADVPVQTLWLDGVRHEIDESGLYASIRFLRRHFKPAAQAPA